MRSEKTTLKDSWGHRAWRRIKRIVYEFVCIIAYFQAKKKKKNAQNIHCVKHPLTLHTQTRARIHKHITQSSDTNYVPAKWN